MLGYADTAKFVADGRVCQRYLSFTAGAGEFRHSPDGRYRAHATSMSTGTLLGGRDCYIEVRVVEQASGRAVEAVLNHRHVRDLFAGTQPSREQVVYLGRLLREVWAAKLARDFPDRRFVVSFPEEGCEGLLDYEVSFYQG